jgi:hypothetical protein
MSRQGAAGSVVQVCFLVARDHWQVKVAILMASVDLPFFLRAQPMRQFLLLKPRAYSYQQAA